MILVNNRPNLFLNKLSYGQTVERNRKHLIWDLGYDNWESSESDMIQKEGIEKKMSFKMLCYKIVFVNYMTLFIKGGCYGNTVPNLEHYVITLS